MRCFNANGYIIEVSDLTEGFPTAGEVIFDTLVDLGMYNRFASKLYCVENSKVFVFDSFYAYSPDIVSHVYDTDEYDPRILARYMCHHVDVLEYGAEFEKVMGWMMQA